MLSRSPLGRLVCCLLALLGCLSLGAPGWARGAPRVTSSVTHLELASDGSARVQHVLRVQPSSGTLQAFALEGVDADASALPEARVTPFDAAGSAGAPLPLTLRIQGGRAELYPQKPERLRGKSFVLEFGYQTQLLARGAIQHLPDGERSLLTWLGPRFAEGVDGVTLVVRARSAAHAPEAGDPSSEAARGGSGNFGILLSTLRRSAQLDELEVARAHVARNEAALWRILVDRSLFARDAVSPDPDATLSADAAGVELDGIWPAPRRGLPRAPLSSELPWLVGAALAYGLLVAAKSRAVQRAAELRGCQVRGLFGGGPALRAGLAGLLLAAASSAVIWLDSPWLGALGWLAALGFATHRPPRSEQRLRGPGQWQPMGSHALAADAAPALPGGWLDVGRLPGCAALLTAVAAISAAALQRFESSPYYGACLLLGSTALLPLFCTGRAGELPGPGLSESQRFLGRVLKTLGGTPELSLQALGRYCTGANDLDELRLAIHPAQALPGWIGMELALEFRPVLTGHSAWPVVVIRTAEDSPCQRAFPRQLTWTRGRSADERAALVRPKLPSVTLTVELIRELTAIATRAAPDGSSQPAPPLRRQTAPKARARRPVSAAAT